LILSQDAHWCKIYLSTHIQSAQNVAILLVAILLLASQDAKVLNNTAQAKHSMQEQWIAGDVPLCLHLMPDLVQAEVTGRGL
jgi:hypothetical protein